MIDRVRSGKVHDLVEVLVLLLCLLFTSCTNVVVRLAGGQEQTVHPDNPISPYPNINNAKIPPIQNPTLTPKFPDLTDILQCNFQETKLDSVPAIPQKNAGACWAASAQTAIISLGEQVEQCEILDKVYSPNGIPTCCANIHSEVCRQGGWPEFAFEKFGYQAEKLVGSTYVDWSILQTEICRKRPMIYAELFTEYIGHSYVINGFRKDANNENIIYIYDHDPELIYEENHTDFVEKPFEEILNPDGLHSFYFYLNIQKSN